MIKYVIVLSLIAINPYLALADSPFPVCRDNPNGIVKDYYESGKLKTEWMCKDSHLNGITNLYYENGQLHKESNYVNDERQDITTSWYEGGELKSVCNFKEGKLIGGGLMIEMLVGLNVKDEKIYQDYRKAMYPLLEKVGGGFRYDFVVAKTLKSQVSHDINRVFTIYFPNTEAKNSFFSNQEYKKIKEKYFDNSVSDTAFIAEYQIDN